MANDNLVSVRIGADTHDYDSGIEQLQQETKTVFNAVKKEVDEAAKAVNHDLATLKDIQIFDGLVESTTKAEKSLDNAKAKLRLLDDELTATGVPTRALTDKIQLQQAAVEKATAAYDKKSAALSEAGARLKVAGVDTSKLAEEEKRLADATKLARLQMGNQTDQMAALKARSTELKTAQLELTKAYQALDVRPFVKIKADIEALEAAYKKLKASGNLSVEELAQAKAHLIEKTRDLKSETNGWMDSLVKARVAVAGSVAALTTLVYGMGKAEQASRDFGLQMANVNTLLNDDKAVAKMSASVRQLSVDMGKNASEMAKGLYDIVSSGVESANAMDVLAQSSKAATAGITDTATASKVGLAVINSYGKDIGELGRVYDVLFQTVKDGVVTFPELANELGSVLPIARAANVSFDEVAASIAQLTKNGLKAPEAATAITGAITQLSAPSAEAAAKLDALGIKWNGLQGTLQQIADKNLSLDILKSIIPDTQGLVAVSSLTKNMQGLRDEVGAMATAAGATDKAYKIIAATPAQKVKELESAFGELKLRMGDLVEKIFAPVAVGLTELIKQFQALPEGGSRRDAGFGGAIGATVGTLAVAINAARPALILIGGHLAAFGSAAVAGKTAAAGLAEGVEGATGKVGGLGRALSALPLAAAALSVGIPIAIDFAERLANASAAVQEVRHSLIATEGDLKRQAESIEYASSGLKNYASLQLQNADAIRQMSLLQRTDYEIRLNGLAELERAEVKRAALLVSAAETERSRLEISRASSEQLKAADAQIATANATLKQHQERLSAAKQGLSELTAAHKDAALSAEFLAIAAGKLGDKLKTAFETKGIEGVATVLREMPVELLKNHQAIDSIKAELDKLDGVKLLNLRAQLQANSSDAAKFGVVLDQIAEVSFKKLGLDAKEVLTGISTKSAEAIASFDGLAASGKLSAEQLKKVFDAALKSVDSEAAVQQLKLKLEEMGKAGKLSAQQIRDGLQLVQEQLIKTHDATTPLEKALERLGLKSKEALRLEADQAIKDVQEVEKAFYSGAVGADALKLALDRAEEAAGKAGLGIQKAMLEAKESSLSVVDDVFKVEQGLKSAGDAGVEAGQKISTSMETAATAAEKTAQRVLSAASSVSSWRNADGSLKNDSPSSSSTGSNSQSDMRSGGTTRGLDSFKSGQEVREYLNFLRSQMNGVTGGKSNLTDAEARYMKALEELAGKLDRERYSTPTTKHEIVIKKEGFDPFSVYASSGGDVGSLVEILSSEKIEGKLMALTLDGIALDEGMLWTDEFDYTPVTQTKKVMFDGSLLIQEGVQSVGRPISLEADQDRGWIARSVVLALQGKLTQSSPMALVLPDGRTFNVRWRHSDKPLEAKPLRTLCVPGDDEPYVAKLRLMTV